MSRFTHLHVHSQYSVLDGQASIPGLIDKAMKDGMSAFAITDHGNMFGTKEFFNKAKAANQKKWEKIISEEEDIQSITDSDARKGEIAKRVKAKMKANELFIKPIFGCEAYVARGGRLDKSGRDKIGGDHLILLAKNKKGYQNLIKLVSLGYIDGFYGKPRIDKEILFNNSEGLIVSSACIGGEIPQLILSNDLAGAENAVNEYKNIFGDDFYLEMQRHKPSNPNADQEVYQNQVLVNKQLLQLSKKTGVKLVATNDSHFIDETDAAAHDVLICLTTNARLDDPNRMRYTQQEWFKTQDEMEQLFFDVPEAIENTMEVANKVEVYDIDNPPIMPDFPIPDDFDHPVEYLREIVNKRYEHEVQDENFDKRLQNDIRTAEYLHYLTFKGAEKRYSEITADVQERLDFELATIIKMGFPGYFLIVQDFIGAAREMGVSVGPGRGSAAGSAVAYCLAITDIDPIKYDLLFERFLNPDRISMPDIDIDFDDDGRAQVLNWVTQKYGKDKVANIVTFGTMGAKSSIKDVARILGLELKMSETLSKLIPDDAKNLKDAFAKSPELSDFRNSDNPLIHDTLEYAVKLEGSVRNTGIHACGVIIGRDTLSNYIPLGTTKDKETEKDILYSQVEGSFIEEVGMLKMDFLGLKTLSIIKDAIKNVELSQNIKIDISTIPLEDEVTFEMFSRGETTGVFQFESDGMKKWLRELKPNRFEDLIAMNALYRPGPMDYIPNYVNRKHGREKIDYPIPVMEKRLDETYGITVYQEQVMLLSRDLAGFTPGESDSLRKAMGKKQIETMNKLKLKFIEGCQKNGHAKDVVEKIWSDWEKFAQYAFNKSHSTCYAYLAYQTGYLKAHYPAEFMAAVLSRNMNDLKDVTFFMDECKKMGIPVLGPDVNESDFRFVVNSKGAIRFGLGAVKGVGEGAVESIIECRKGEPYKNIFDFARRINLKSVNKRCFEALAQSGGFDGFGNVHRAQFLHHNNDNVTFIDKLIRYTGGQQSQADSDQISLFDDVPEQDTSDPELPKCEPWSKLELLKREKEMIGIYISGHPLDIYKWDIKSFCNHSLSDLLDVNAMRNRDFTIAGVVTAANHRVSAKNGKPFGELVLEDYESSYMFRLFSDDYIKFKEFLEPGWFLFIKGKVESRYRDSKDVEPRIHSIGLLSDIREKSMKRIVLSMNIHSFNREDVVRLVGTIKKYPGTIPLKINVYDENEKISVDLNSTSIKVEPTNELFDLLEKESMLKLKIE